MIKTCIICGKGAGSGEHVFPAAFGGRRTDRGIYCHEHNQNFGSYVTVLLDQLDVLNAAIGVIPDGEKEVRPARIKGADGETYLLTGNTAELAPPPPLDQTPELIGREVLLKFASTEQAHKWMGEQRAKGYQFAKTVYGEESTRLLTEPFHLGKELGGAGFRTALAYLALTFLANNFRAVARDAGLTPIKDILDGKGDIETRVWWLHPKKVPQLPANPFKHGHTVAVSLSKETGRVTALISLYGDAHFGVDLGTAALEETITVTTHIDPLAASARNSIHKVPEPGRYLALGTVEEGMAYLQEVLAQTAPPPLHQAFDTQNVDAQDQDANELLLRLQVTQAMPRRERQAAISALVEDSQQRVFNLLQFAVAQFTQTLPPELAPIRAALSLLVAPERGAGSGLSATANAALHVAKQVLIQELVARAEADDLTAASLKDLLGGTVGAQLMMRSVIAPALQLDL